MTLKPLPDGVIVPADELPSPQVIVALKSLSGPWPGSVNEATAPVKGVASVSVSVCPVTATGTSWTVSRRLTVTGGAGESLLLFLNQELRERGCAPRVVAERGLERAWEM